MQWRHIKTTVGLAPPVGGMLMGAACAAFRLYGLAEKIIRRQADKWPGQRPLCLLEIGNLYERRNDFERAEALYKEAIAIDPKGALGYVKLGNLYEQRNNTSLAVTNYQIALRVEEGLTEDFREMILVRIDRLAGQ